MTQTKLNCWEYMKCGREPGGEKTGEFGVCPAATDTSFNGLKNGKNAGRLCWAVAGTFCGGKIQGAFADKRNSCIKCEFYKLVLKEEGTEDSDAKFLKYISENSGTVFLSQLSFKHIRAGNRFITQGISGEETYIIQRGTCLAVVEKNGEFHPVSHHGKGDIIGLKAVMTGEPRSAHIEAETDMELWVLHKSQLESISENDPELQEFLTEIVASQFDSKRPMAERVIGKYIATDIIGRGGYSLVYKGVHADLNMPVAIKMMRHDLVMNSDFLTNFRNEAKIIAKLDHENIIRVFDIEERFRTVFIIMEHLEGESLKDLLSRLKTIHPMLAADYLFQVCSGLEYAHRQGVIHRDINALNIFVQPQDRLKLIDFGLACRLGTEDFLMGGALPYLAPELFDGGPANERTDIYALGITAYEMLTGKNPYPDADSGELMKIRRTRDIPDPAREVSGLPEELRRFIIKACCRNPEERYQNVSQVLEDIRPLIRKDKPSFYEKRKITTLFLFHTDRHQQALNRLLEDFSANARKIGVELKITDLRDV
ncbi:MAG: protein kinase [Desulfobacterales bacterium]|nr:protein kinase [Desulfobacterales bacterium]